MTRWVIAGQQSESDMVGLASMLFLNRPAQRGTIHNDHVPIYTVSVRSDRTGFDIEVISADGHCQIIRGLKTMAEADACIAYNRLLTDAVDLGEQSGLVMPWSW